MKIIIQNGRVIDPANHVDKITDLVIENGKILKLGKVDNFTPDKTIDARNLMVIPGLVDISCRPQMQSPHGTTLYQEAQSAIKRGITSICVPPDADPIIDTPANVMRIIQQSDIELPHIYPIGALTSGLQGESIADLTALQNAGCVAFSNAQKPIKDLRMLRHCYDYAASFDLLIVIQPQDPWLSQGGIAHEGIVASRLGLPSIPEIAETIAIAQHLLLIEQCNVRAHFTCLSSQHAVKQISDAKAQGLKVTADTAMHQLHLTENDLCHFDANCHLYPPLRSTSDRNALVAGVKNGVINAICSDHRPLDTIAKLAPFGESLPGLTALDTFFGLGLHLVEQKQLDLLNLIAAITFGPARNFNLPAGTLNIGACADICILDPKKTWVVEEETLLSNGKNTPFKQWELQGMVTHTLHRGKLVYEHQRS